MEEVASSPLPRSLPCPPGDFAERMRYLASALPRQNKDGVAGELMVAAYRRHLAEYSAEALDFLVNEAPRELDWFPTIKQCLSILSRFEARDAQMIRMCRALAERERWERFKDMKRAVRNGCCDPAMIARLTDRQRATAREEGLIDDDDQPREDAAWFKPLQPGGMT